MRLAAACALMAILLFTFPQQAQSQQTEKLPIDRYALYVAANNGGPGREVLRYAGSDAERVSQALSELGGVPPSKSILLIDPLRSDIEHAFESITGAIKRNAGTARRTEFIFYYSGHSDESSLLLGSDTYGYQELKTSLNAVPSDVHVVMLDSCYSGNFVRTKGGSRQKPFLMDDSTVVQGHAYLSSSSEFEASQESDVIQASYFTHALVTGLRGAADTSGDGKVSLNELYHYAFNETLAKTELSTIGPQHPSYNITLVGSGDLVLTDISDAESMIHIPSDQEGSYFFRNSGGILVSEINKVKGTEVALALPAGYYQVSLVTPTAASQCSIRLERGEKISLTASRFAKVARTTGRARGDAQADIENAEGEYDSFDDFNPFDEEEIQAIRTYALERALAAAEGPQTQVQKQTTPDTRAEWTPFVVSIFPGLEYPQNPGDYINIAVSPFIIDTKYIDGIQATGFLASVTESLKGIQAAGFMTSSKGIMNGVQVAGFMCSAESDEPVNGMQAAGFLSSVEGSLMGPQFAGFLNSVSGELKGIQAAGFLNSCEGFVEGGQGAGFLNSAESGFDGIQAAGFLNTAGEQSRGVQIAGFINIADEIEGLQLGVVNVANRNTGIAIGVLNFIKEGIMSPAIYMDTNGNGWVQYQGGTKHFFTSFCLGIPIQTDRQLDLSHAIFGFGIGHRLLDKGMFSADIELFSKVILDPNMFGEYENTDEMSDEEKIAMGKDYSSMQIPSLRVTGNIHFSKHLSIFAALNADMMFRGYNEKAFTYGKTGPKEDFGNKADLFTHLSFGIKF